MRGRKSKVLLIKEISNKELGYLIGLFAGDGYMFHDKKGRHYSVEFHLNSDRDKEIIKITLKLLERIGLKTMIYQDKRCNCKRIRTYSKEFFQLIKMESYKEDSEFGIGFVSGFIDSDGYYNKKNSTLEIINTDMEKLKRAKAFLDKIKVNSVIKKRVFSKFDKKQSYRLRISDNGTKLTTIFYVYHKNQIL
jgi:hypothetical protein